MLIGKNGDGISRENCRAMVAAGWQAIDLNDTTKTELFHKSEEEYMAYLREAVANAREAGLVVGQCHAPMPRPMRLSDAEEREYLITAVERCVAAAGKLGIPYTVVHPFEYDFHSQSAEGYGPAFDLNVKYLRRILRAADGTVVCLENMPGKGVFLKGGLQMKLLLDAVGDERLMVCLDTGHLFSQGEKASAFFERVGDRVKVTHIHDTTPGEDHHLPVYAGRIDWNDFKETIKKYGYTGNLSCESSYVRRMPAAFRAEASAMEFRWVASLME